jgi:NhaP-type Na+/H+ or K+/H+ antiporter
MLTSLALIFLVGLSLATVSGMLKLPRLVGMLLTGILLGPFVLDLLDPQILGILAVMSMAMVYAIWTEAAVVDRLKDKYGKLWLAAEVLLFVLVGAAVDIRYTLSAGLGAILMDSTKNTLLE